MDFVGDLHATLSDLLVETRTVRWPSAKYVGPEFAETILGFEPWSRQREILTALRQVGSVAVTSGRKTGKLLHDDTPIPTPQGWRRHGDLRPGDFVFAPDGSPTRITATIPWAARPLMRVHFEDGTHVDADERHEWSVLPYRCRRRPGPHMIVETRDLARRTKVGCGLGKETNNWTVDLPAPIQQPEADLPLDPYLLGLWLGDGAAASGTFTNPDEELKDAFMYADFEVTTGRTQRTKRTQKGEYLTHYVRGLTTVLRRMGVLDRKHVPHAYLWASAPQRLALLQGLMDTDGWVDPKGRAEFTNTNRQIAESVLHLARSLGIKARIAEHRAKLYGEDHGPVWDVSWSSPVQVFRLARKAARIRTKWTTKKNAHRRIAITAVEPLPGLHGAQCIEVEHASHLYLCGESMVPTHNSTVAATAALEFFATVPRGHVFLHMPRAPQIEKILWPEIVHLHRQSGRCVECRRLDPEGPRPCPHSTPLDGTLSPRSTTGLRSDDGRFIVGVTSKTIESVSGHSGPQLHVVDESAGVADEVFDAIAGNSMGGSVWFLFVGNPTKTRGRYAEIFLTEKYGKAFHRVQMSSEEAAKARDRQGNRYGHLATSAKIEEYKELWGAESPLYKIHVLGQHVIGEDGSAFSVHAIAEAVARWHEDPGEGRLYLGVDPAGASGLGDETAIARRRGTKILRIDTMRGLDEDAILAEIIRVVECDRIDREVPVVVVDREGSIGSVLHSRIIEYLDRFRLGQRKPFEYVPVKSSLPAERMPQAYLRGRDEVIANFERWLRTGSIPDDDKLAKELNVVEWNEQVDQRLRATPKDEMRRILERSPDRMDAAMLSVWDSMSLRLQPGDQLPPGAQAVAERDRRALDQARTPAGGWEGFGGDDSSSGRTRDAHRAMAEQRGRRPR
ncbi:MAG: hypothetical protein J0L92_03695 [Deltaproteobacteria bacterium]|nr:hypothetical protein [Deltaproteobacteria bacterium]